MTSLPTQHTSGEAAPEPAQPPQAGGASGRKANFTRWVAGAVLLPTIPLLLLSVLALAAFYAAPERFGELLNRLPGDRFIRTGLIFAPATLFAVAVLAALYAVEWPGRAPRATAARIAASRIVPSPRVWVRAALPLGLVLLSAAVLVLTLVAPGRTGRLLETVTGGAIGVGGFQALTFVGGLLAMVLLAREWAAGQPPAQDRTRPALAPWARASALLVLLPTIPMLALSVFGLWISYASPDAFTDLVERLPLDDWIRLALIFAPTSLAAILFLGLLVLRGVPVRVGGDTQVAAPLPVEPELRETLAVWVLLGGLALTAALTLGLLGAVLVLFIR